MNRILVGGEWAELPHLPTLSPPVSLSDILETEAFDWLADPNVMTISFVMAVACLLIAFIGLVVVKRRIVAHR